MKNVMMLLLLMAGGIQDVSADDITANDINFSGTLVDTLPCEINDGQPVEIDFGDVGVNKVDGQNYQQPFKLTYVCEGTAVDMVLRYMGVATTFDNSAVQSNIPDFGIRLQHTKNGVVTALDVGSTLPIPSYVGSSSFIATPVKKADAELQEGHFTAAATLRLEYP